MGSDVIKFNVPETIRVIRLSNPFDTDSQKQLNHELARAIVKAQKGIIYDLENITEMKSEQAAVFFSFMAAVRDNGFKQTITNANAEVRKIFDLIGILSAVPYHVTFFQAIDYLEAGNTD